MRNIPPELCPRSLLFLFFCLLATACKNDVAKADPTGDLARQSMARIRTLYNQNNCRGMFTQAVLESVDNGRIDESCQDLRRAAGEWRAFTVTRAEFISTSTAPLSILTVKGTAAFQQGTYDLLGYWDPSGSALRFLRVDDQRHGTVATFPAKTKFVFRSKGQ